MTPVVYLTPAGHMWNTTFEGEPLTRLSRDPEHEACRALLARGVTGRVTFIQAKTGTPGLSMDIEKGARLTVREDGRLRLVKYSPFPGDVSLPARDLKVAAGYVPADIERLSTTTPISFDLSSLGALS
jgi:hypothetical protein